MQLSAESTLTKARLKKFTHWTYYRRDYSMKILLLVLTLFVAISWSTFLIKDASNLVTMALLVIEVLVLAAMYLYPTWSAALAFRGRPSDRLTERIVFGDDGFEATNDGNPAVVDITKVRYEGLVLVVEEPESFYFFTDRSRAFIVYKYDFTEGDTDELAAHLQEVLAGRYLWEK